MRGGIVCLVGSALFLGAVGCGGGGGSTEPPAPGAIQGRVGAGATNVAGASVALTGGASRTATTDAAGQFRFDNLAAGNYSVALTVPTGFQLGPAEAATKAASVLAGQTATINWELVAAGGGGNGTGVQEVRLNAATFEPADVQITVGQTVRFVGIIGDHTVTPNNANQEGAWTGFALSAGQNREITFNVAGTFDYHCIPHAPVMVGRIVVVAS